MVLRQEKKWLSSRVALSRVTGVVAEPLKSSSILGISRRAPAVVTVRLVLIALIIFSYAVFNVSSQASMRKIIIDTDPGPTMPWR